MTIENSYLIYLILVFFNFNTDFWLHIAKNKKKADCRQDSAAAAGRQRREPGSERASERAKHSGDGDDACASEHPHMHSMLFSVLCPCAFDLTPTFFLSPLLFNKFLPTIHPQLASQPATVASCISQRLSLSLSLSIAHSLAGHDERKKERNQETD
jgi:hypothetical protein